MKMDKQRWQQVETLYHAALEHEPGARVAFLAQVCAGDEELRSEVASLLNYDDKPASFIETVAKYMAAVPGDTASGAGWLLFASLRVAASGRSRPAGATIRAGGGMGESYSTTRETGS